MIATSGVERPTVGAGLDRLLRPSSVAVVGASPRSRWNRQILENVRRSGFVGEVAAVNPRYDEISGITCYPSLSEVPFAPDAVVAAVAAERVADVVSDAGDAGAGGVVAFAGGFAEAGPDGARLQERVREAALERGLAVLGPNCQGMLNLVQPCALYLDLVPEPLAAGSAALISQSGSVATAVLNNQRGARFSHVITVGNEAVVETPDVISTLSEDPAVTSFALFLEAIRSPSQFATACRRAHAAGKRVVAVVSGRSEEARAASASHSGALAPPDRLVDAFLTHLDIPRVGGLEELVETSVALAAESEPGPRLAVLSLSGGLGQLAVDAIAPTRCEVAELSPGTLHELAAVLPPGAHSANPIDAWSPMDLEPHFRTCLEIVGRDEDVDTVVAVVDVTAAYPTTDPQITQDALAALRAFRAATGKQATVITPLAGNVGVDVAESLALEGIPLLSGLEAGIRAIGIAASPPRREPGAPTPRPEAATAATMAAELASRDELGGGYSGLPALDVISAAGIPIVDTAEATTTAEVGEAATRLGAPVVVKTADPAVLHKTEADGVALDLDGADAAIAAAEPLLARGGAVLVQSQLGAGVELLIGVRPESVLGSFVLVGIGGVHAEILDDVAVAPVDASDDELSGLLDRLRLAELLRGYRGEPAVDRGAVVEVLSRVAALARALPMPADIDLNPVFATPEGAVAVDALFVPSEAAGREEGL